MAVYPQFAESPAAEYYFNDTVSWAQTRWNLSRFGSRVNTAVYLLTAHRLYLSTLANSGQAGQGSKVASANVDGVSVSFSTMPNTNNLNYWLSLSPYGIELAALLDTLCGLPDYTGGSFERVFN